MEKIDFVVTWLDSSDPLWINDYNKFKNVNSSGDLSRARFRNWDLFRFWFRSVEKYAPWVNRVFLITNGTFPKWLNKDNPKLILVKHSDYIPEDVLPTFNSVTIELYMHKIKGLSEQFVYFNDDMYINAAVNPDYFFKEGLPCDCNQETFFNVPKYTPQDRFNIYTSMLADIGVINRHFNRKLTIGRSLNRWFGLHLGKGLLTSIISSLDNKGLFTGFAWDHCEMRFLKSTFEEVWEREKDLLESSCTRFRQEVILNPYVFRYWQFASNHFNPVKRNNRKLFRPNKKTLPSILEALNCPSLKSLCINDSPLISDIEYEYVKQELYVAFSKKLPDKSSFET